MTRHPLDTTALILGLLFALSGLAVISDQAWPELDTTAVLGVAVGSLGLVFAATLIARQVRENNH